MVYIPVTVLGGLSCIAEVSFCGPDYVGVDGLYWEKPDGSRGVPFSTALMERIERKDQHWQGAVVEQANDWLAYEARESMPFEGEGFGIGNKD